MNVLLILILSLASFHFKDETSCKQNVINAYKSSAEKLKVLTTGKAIFFEIYTTSFYKNPNRKKTLTDKAVSKTTIYTNGRRSFFSDGNITVFQDEIAQVTILKKQKQIQINSVSATSLTGANFLTLSSFRDSLLRTSQVIECESLQGKDNLKKTIFKVRKDFSERSGADRMEYFLDEQKKAIKQLNVLFRPGFAVSRVELSFSVEEERNTDLLEKSAKAQVINSKGKLLQEYAGYKLVNFLK